MEQVVTQSKFEFTQKISEEIFNQKYNLHNEKDADEIFKSVSREISLSEKKDVNKIKYEKLFTEIMMNSEFFPAGRVTANAREFSKMKNYNNCFLIAIKDSMNGITQSLSEYMKIGQKGGGVGINLTPLRPRGAKISSGGTSSGALSFANIFNTASDTIKIGGSRRMATMLSLEVQHPEIEDFITCKRGDKNKVLKNANLSVMITDEFMKAVKSDSDFDLVFKGEVYKTVKARELFDKIAYHSFWYAEPGILLIDTINKEHNLSHIAKVTGVNPCGEQTLSTYTYKKKDYYGSCNLGSIVLSTFVKNPFTKEAYIDYVRMGEVIKLSVRFLDNVIDRMKAPLPAIDNQMLATRNIGLGITGLGDLFAKLRIQYGSKESKELSKELSRFKKETEYNASIDLAREKGAFPFLKEFGKKRYLDSPFIKRLSLDTQRRLKKYGIRNALLSSVAPCGTLSLTVGNNCSSGIEPIFSLQYDRNITVDGIQDNFRTERIFDKAWLEYLKYTDSLHSTDVVVPDYFNTTMTVDPYDKVDIISIWQENIDTAISNTTNLPLNFDFEKYKDLFEYAYDKKLKGITTYWAGGHLSPILSEVNDETKSDRPTTIIRTPSPKRPESLDCDIHHVKVMSEQFIVLVGRLEDGSIYEVFADNHDDEYGKYKTGKIVKFGKGSYDLIVKDDDKDLKLVKNIGKQFNETYRVLSRLISGSLRHGMDLEFVVSQLLKGKSFISFEKAVARVLKKYIKDGEIVKSSKVCPECGSTKWVFQSGCESCMECGHSLCG